MKNTTNKGGKLVLILITIGFISPAVFGASQSIELGEGWNTVSIDIQDVSSSDLQNQCDSLTTFQGEHVWVLESGSWSNPQTLPTAKGVYLRTSSDCSIDLEGDSASPSELSISEGWNLISLSGGITWENVLECDIQSFEDYQSWILTGNSWSHLDSGSSGPPSPGDGSELRNKGILLQSSSDCTVSSDGGIPMPGDNTGNTGSDDTDDSDNTDDSSNTDTDEGSDINPGDLYFWDTEASRGIVNNEAGSPDDDANLEYDMYDNDVVGGFTSKGQNQAERTVVVENEYNGETSSNTGSGHYVGVPTNSATWGTEEDGVNQMSSYGGTDFTVKVKDPNTDEVVQEETFTFNPSSQPRTITTDFENRNTDHVRTSGSNVEIDGSGGKNAYATWSTDSSSDKTVEVDFEVNDKGHTRLEVCGSSCGDGSGGDIDATYYFFGDNNIRIDQPYDNSYDEKLGEYETGSEYTFRIIQSGYDVDMELEGPGIDHSRDLDAYSFEQFSIDTEAGTSDGYPGIDITVNDVTIEE